MKSAEMIALEKRMDRIEKIVMANGEARLIGELLSEVDNLTREKEVLVKQVKYAQSAARDANDEVKRMRERLAETEQKHERASIDCGDLKRGIQSVYNRICAALTYYEAPEDREDPDYDIGAALYNDIVSLQNDIDAWGLCE